MFESWNIILNFSTFSVRGCWGQPMSFFWKLVDETQIFLPPEATRHHNLIKFLILLPNRADLLYTLHYETPCTTMTDLILKNVIEIFVRCTICERWFNLLCRFCVNQTICYVVCEHLHSLKEGNWWPIGPIMLNVIFEWSLRT